MLSHYNHNRSASPNRQLWNQELPSHLQNLPRSELDRLYRLRTHNNAQYQQSKLMQLRQMQLQQSQSPHRQQWNEELPLYLQNLPQYQLDDLYRLRLQSNKQYQQSQQLQSPQQYQSPQQIQSPHRQKWNQELPFYLQNLPRTELDQLYRLRTQNNAQYQQSKLIR